VEPFAGMMRISLQQRADSSSQDKYWKAVLNASLASTRQHMSSVLEQPLPHNSLKAAKVLHPTRVSRPEVHRHVCLRYGVTSTHAQLVKNSGLPDAMPHQPGLLP